GIGLRILHENIRGQRFGSQAEMQCLLGRHHAGGTPQFEKAVETQFCCQYGRECDQDECNHQRDAALPLSAALEGLHPETSTRRRIAPQSLNWMMISTATGRDCQSTVEPF